MYVVIWIMREGGRKGKFRPAVWGLFKTYEEAEAWAKKYKRKYTIDLVTPPA